MKFETLRPALIVGAAAALLVVGACKKSDAADANSAAMDASAQANTAVNAAAASANAASNTAP